MKNNLIMFEGGDATGKTTSVNLLKDELIEKGYSVLHTHLITGSDIGKAFYAHWGKDGSNEIIDTCGMLASVTTTLTSVILPATQEYDFVLVDRSLASILTYQVNVNGHEWFRPIVERAMGEYPQICEHKTIYFSVDPKTAMERLHASGKELDYNERRGEGYQRLVQEAYKDTFHHYPQLQPDLYIATDHITPTTAVDLIIKELRLSGIRSNRT